VWHIQEKVHKEREDAFTKAMKLKSKRRSMVKAGEKAGEKTGEPDKSGRTKQRSFGSRLRRGSSRAGSSRKPNSQIAHLDEGSGGSGGGSVGPSGEPSEEVVGSGGGEVMRGSEVEKFQSKCKRCGQVLMDMSPEALMDVLEDHDAVCDGVRVDHLYSETIQPAPPTSLHTYGEDQDGGSGGDDLTAEEEQIWHQMTMESELEISEQLIAEREKGIQDICREMRHVKDLFGEVAELVADQVCIAAYTFPSPIPCAYRVHTMCIPCAYRVHAMCIPCAYRVHTLCIPCAYHVHTMCIPCAYHVHTMCIPCAYRVHTMCIPCAYRVHTMCIPCAYTLMCIPCAYSNVLTAM
jgi:hypothetical protein